MKEGDGSGAGTGRVYVAWGGGGGKSLDRMPGMHGGEGMPEAGLSREHSGWSAPGTSRTEVIQRERE